MNDTQRVVTATFVVALLVAAFFYVPWRRDGSGEIRWAPLHRAPITLESTIRGSTVYNEYARVKGRPMYGLYALQLLGIAGTGFLLFRLTRTREAS